MVPEGWKPVNESCFLPYDKYCGNDKSYDTKAKLGCNWLQASMGCKRAGGHLAELADPEKEKNVLTIITDGVNGKPIRVVLGGVRI